MTLEQILAVRPSPGQPRKYEFPHFDRTVLPSGMQVITVNVPDRPLVSANLLVRRGVTEEPADLAGATILMARAMTEGTEPYPGVELLEAGERLGATLHVDASWDAFTASVEVAASRLGAALELLAELVERPIFPESDVARLREERLNDLLQINLEQARGADEVPGFVAKEARGANDVFELDGRCLGHGGRRGKAGEQGMVWIAEHARGVGNLGGEPNGTPKDRQKAPRQRVFGLFSAEQ